MYQYTLKYDVVDKRVTKGDRFLCTKDVCRNGVKTYYTQGKTYVSEFDECITDDEGDTDHAWPVDPDDHNWWDYFTKIPHPVEKCNCNKCEEVKDKDYFQSVQEEYGEQKDIRQFETGAIRDSNQGKPLIHTLLGYTRQRFGYHMAKNAGKYGPFNFLKGIPTEAALESLDRHLAAYMAKDRSEDHLSAIIFGVQCCMLNEEKDGLSANHYFKD